MGLCYTRCMDKHEALKFRLIDELQKRKNRNAAYSMRSFSKYLGIGHSALSEILSGKRPITDKSAEKLCDKLLLDPEERQFYLKGVGSSKTAANKAKPSLELAVDHYHLVSDWFCFAILSLGEVKATRLTVARVVDYFGLSQRLAGEAMERLVRVGLLKKARGRFSVTGRSFQSPLKQRTQAFIKNQIQSLKISEQSLLEDHEDQTDFCSITMAIDPTKLPEARRRIRQFRDELCDYLESGDQTEVYRWNMQLVPLKGKGESHE